MEKEKLEEQGTSPIPQAETRLMSFYEALAELQNGVKITKVEWGNEDVYGILKDGVVMLHKDDDKFYNWIISDGDLGGDDWYVI